MSTRSKGEQCHADNEGSFSKVFRDPVHDLIRLGPEDKFILELIDTKEFQRLRRIRQLGLGHFVYPGAEHTRFTHSLGVFNFARRIIATLKEQLSSAEDAPIRQELKDKARVIKAAALLHDIGHGPFSHLFERIFENEDVVDHEQWTCNILLDKSTEVAQILGKQQIDASQILALVCDVPPPGVSPPVHPYLKDIVHSQLDADRMDYLLRDSLMTGSRYGDFDSEWILNILALGTMRSGTSQVMKLCLDARKGTGAIERLLHARLLMTKYVYAHKTTRAYEAELIMTIRLAMHLADVLPEETPTPVHRVLKQKGKVGMGDYLMLDDEMMWWALRCWAGCSVPTNGPRTQLAEALRRHSLRLVRRLKPWKTIRLSNSSALRAATSLRNKLRRDEGNPLRYECYLDTLAKWPYKDPAAAVRGGADAEEAYFEDIHLVQNGHAVPVREAEDTPILGALAEKWAEYRFHYDRSFSTEFAGLFHEFGIC